MIQLRPSDARGQADHGWLKARHSFSFAEYHDPREMGWGALRVINEDRVAPGTGFPMHGHRDMEIVTYILSGTLEHKDSLGNGGLIRRGEVQRMSAGKGILHSEFNPSREEETHLLQIWIEPAARGGSASYEQRQLFTQEASGRLFVVASPDGRDGSTVIQQDALLLAAHLEAGEAVSHALAPGRLAYVHVIRGQLSLNGQTLSAGDGAKIHDEASLAFSNGEGAGEFLLFDLPPVA
jgi:redox-sensitive bicupin YhaK (pirin superfamily)